ncbi:MAG: hypothetical protein DRP45_08355 [Candidatus Zixiibacteriota bacterium]|nr:MAG: hypothetical protein DRP45_08355 [candidate division Zixibacteria bacterium]
MTELHSVTPDFSTADEEDYSLFAEAMLGEGAETFLRTELGRYLTGCAKQEIEDCSYQLLTVAPWRKRKIAAIQAKAGTAKNFLVWINEAISAGHNAHQQLSNKR